MLLRKRIKDLGLQISACQCEGGIHLVQVTLGASYEPVFTPLTCPHATRRNTVHVFPKMSIDEWNDFARLELSRSHGTQPTYFTRETDALRRATPQPKSPEQIALEQRLAQDFYASMTDGRGILL